MRSVVSFKDRLLNWIDFGVNDMMMRSASKIPEDLYHPKLSQDDIEFFRDFVLRYTGICLSSSKIASIQFKVGARMRANGVPDVRAYRKFLEAGRANGRELQLLINEFTTNKTEFFREMDHFHFLINEFLPSWRQKGKSHLKVWSAASSTGEEAYSLAMLLLENYGQSFHITATDIDTDVLQIASNGVYDNTRTVAIPKELKSRFLIPGTGAISNWSKISKSLKAHVEFKQFNLMSNAYPWNSEFDVIFCRNVMIYFSPKTVQVLIEKLYAAAAPDALFCIGKSESLSQSHGQWKYIKPSIYRKSE